MLFKKSCGVWLIFFYKNVFFTPNFSGKVKILVSEKKKKENKKT